MIILRTKATQALTSEPTRDLLEIIQDCYDVGSMLIIKQVPVDRPVWLGSAASLVITPERVPTLTMAWEVV